MVLFTQAWDEIHMQISDKWDVNLLERIRGYVGCQGEAARAQ